MAEYRNSAVASEEVYKMLEQYDLPKTVSTILAAQGNDRKPERNVQKAVCKSGRHRRCDACRY